MTNSRTPISFVATDHPETAKMFYRDTLGLELIESSPYALAFSDGGHMLRVQIVAEHIPVSHTVHGWQVADIEQEITALRSKGVEFLTFDQLEQNASGVWTSPGGHKIAWLKDPSGNVLSLTEYGEAEVR